MKMSDIFTLPFVLTEKEDVVNGAPVTKFILTEDGGKKSYNTAMLGYEETSAQHIVDALNAHDTQLADIDRLLEALRPFAKDYEWYLRTGMPADAISASLQVAHQVCDKHKGG